MRKNIVICLAGPNNRFGRDSTNIVNLTIARRYLRILPRTICQANPRPILLGLPGCLTRGSGQSIIRPMNVKPGRHTHCKWHILRSGIHTASIAL